MSMRPQPIGPVPQDTARVAIAAFPKGNVYMQIRDVLGTIYDDEDSQSSSRCADARHHAVEVDSGNGDAGLRGIFRQAGG